MGIRATLLRLLCAAWGSFLAAKLKLMGPLAASFLYAIVSFMLQFYVQIIWQQALAIGYSICIAGSNFTAFFYAVLMLHLATAGSTPLL